MFTILEEKIQNVSNRSSIAEAVHKAAALDYDALKAISDNSSSNPNDLKSKDSERTREYRQPDINFEERFLAENFYTTATVNPAELYTETKPSAASSLDDYESSAAWSNTETETMTTEEAKEMMQEVQYATVTGSSLDIDRIKRQRFANWAMFEPGLRELFHKQYAVTGDVNYSRTF